MTEARPPLHRRLRHARRRPRYSGPSFNRLVPNILTMLGLCCGLTALRFALDGRWEKAAALIVVAAAIDGIDGRIARLLKATSRFAGSRIVPSKATCWCARAIPSTWTAWTSR
jgi:CDP-diacylglycerol--serine O-phosphatidyltransferase